MTLEECAGIIANWADRYEAINTVYLFGSFARREARPDSDVDIWLTYNNELPQERFGAYCNQESDSFDDLKVMLGRKVHYPKGDPSVEELIARSKYNNAEYRDRKVICIATRSFK